MVAMDSKCGRIYCAISDVKILPIVMKPITLWHIKELMGVYKSVSEFHNFAPKNNVL